MEQTQTQTRTLPLLPLTSGVVLPQMVVTLALETDEARAAVESAVDGHVLLVPKVEDTYARVGTIAKLENEGELDNGTRAVVMRGLQRALIGSGVAGAGRAIWVQVEPVEDPVPTVRARELAREYRAVVESIAEMRGGRRRTGLVEVLRGVEDPGAIADLSGWSQDLSTERKLEVLETLDVEARLEKVIAWARDTLGEMQLRDRIRKDVSEKMERTQREFFLRQQMESIRKELGEDSSESVADRYRSKLAERTMPDAIREAISKEIDRLERTSEQSPEHGWIRTWIEWQLDVPWGIRSDDNLDVGAARAVLDADHTGLDDVKERIVEFLAVRKLRADRGIEQASKGAIIALVGPPGVGKTSLGESVARALGRKFVRIALGGIRDEAEIRGHRRTYVAAQPGRVVRALKEAGTMNPVLVLDEVDKVGSDWRGDPSSALLEVLDPAQNHTFRDHYLEVDLDLSDVLFLATANVVETIPAALLDRMEVVRLDGYTADEKVAIARDHLVARQLERNGLRDEEVAVTDEALRTIVEDYTREAGVRNLERELGKVLRKAATRIASGEATTPVSVDVDEVRRALGRRKFWSETAERTSVPGVATGLAVTGTGGDVLFVEATSMDGEAGLTITGQLGDVMKESAQIALSWVRAHAGSLGIERADRRFHVHVPAGAVPKDGPSAGVTMTTALTSLLTGRPVKSTLGMTGEVTLQGKVLPIGGVKQKVLAAHRAGLTEVILPDRNGPDLEDVPEAVREQMTFHLVKDVQEVLDLALEDEERTAVAVPA